MMGLYILIALATFSWGFLIGAWWQATFRQESDEEALDAGLDAVDAEAPAGRERLLQANGELRAH